MQKATSAYVNKQPNDQMGLCWREMGVRSAYEHLCKVVAMQQ